MQQRTAILLIGVILTVGLSIVGGIGIADVSAADTLVVDNDGTTEYNSIQVAIDDAPAGDTVEIQPETTKTDTSIDTQTTPSRPGEVTNATSQNPSPSENRGRFAFLGEDASYTTADDVDGDVGNGATIFQGEEDITFRDASFNEVSPATLERTAGDNEGVTLSVPMPDNQAGGGYSNGAGFSVTVQGPRVTTLEIQNNGGEEVSGGILEFDQDDASVLVEYNYEEAENIELTIEGENGVDVTGEVLDVGEVDNKNADSATPSGSAPDGSVRFELNPSNLDEGDYTFSVAGVEDFDSGDATQSVRTTISADQPASLSLSEDEAVQGSDTTFTIENSPEEEFHPVVIESNEFRDGVSLAQAEDVFRNVGDIVERGVADNNGPGASDIADVEYAYAIIEIDGGNGIGSIETQFLDDSSATVELYPSDGVTPIESHPASVVLTTDDGFETDDEKDLNIDMVSPTDVTRTVSPSEASPGSTVAVTTEITSASGAVSTSSDYDPQFPSATVAVTVNGDAADPIISEANGNGSAVTLGDVGTDATVTITEELTVGEELNVTHTVTGDVTLEGTTTDVEAVSVTVADTEPQSVVDEFDADGNGDISIIELGQAGQAFASGELSITELGQIGAAFAS